MTELKDRWEGLTGLFRDLREAVKDNAVAGVIESVIQAASEAASLAKGAAEDLGSSAEKAAAAQGEAMSRLTQVLGQANENYQTFYSDMMSTWECGPTMGSCAHAIDQIVTSLRAECPPPEENDPFDIFLKVLDTLVDIAGAVVPGLDALVWVLDGPIGDLFTEGAKMVDWMTSRCRRWTR